MEEDSHKKGWVGRLKAVFIGKARDLSDKNLFHAVSLAALFAWVGLGSDGLSSACYGPAEAFKELLKYPSLGLFVGLATALTVGIISASYSQIIELFPSGGGGYVVASKLLSPKLGLISGCALLLDYALTIAMSVAGGTAAIFSMLPEAWGIYKVYYAIGSVVFLIVLNLRGVRESVSFLMPIFFVFIITHVFVILYVIISHVPQAGAVIHGLRADIGNAHSELGLLGMFVLIIRGYSMGAGTYTGLEAISNGLPILREPRVQTAKRAMFYLSVSLSFMVVGLMIGYILCNVTPSGDKTLNAILLENITKPWHTWGYPLLMITLISEAAILFVGAQTGFLDGPRVLSNMALDRWFPTKFTLLSDRLVTQNGVLLIGGAAILMILITWGNISSLVVLYSIIVFITFFLSQLGMVRHWWASRNEVATWMKKLTVNGIGFVITTFLLISLIYLQFNNGGWKSLLLLAILVSVAIVIKRHYKHTAYLLRRLDDLVEVTALASAPQKAAPPPVYDSKAKTAVLFVNGFNGIGLHTLFNVLRLFSGVFKNYVFVSVGLIDAGNFKGPSEIDRLKAHVSAETEKYVQYMRQQGVYAEGYTTISTDVIEAVEQITPAIRERFSNAVYFGGQLVFPNESFFHRWLHNYFIFAIQRRFYYKGLPLLILPIRV